MGFLTPEPELFHAHAPGFALFGAGHGIALGLSLAFVMAVVRCYRRLPADASGPTRPRRRLLRILSGSAVALICGKCLSYGVLGLFEPLFWPLHICNLCEFIALGYALSPRSALGQRLADLLFCWGVTGCLCALAFPGWHGYCPLYSFASVAGFAEHALVLACGLCLVARGDYTPHPGRIWFVLLVTVACGGLFRWLNPLWGTNFFFVTRPDAAGGPGPWMLATFGDPGFLGPYLVLAVCLWALTYGIYCLVNPSSAPVHRRSEHDPHEKRYDIA